MELISTVHVAEQWRHGEVQNKKKKKKKEKEKGRRPWAVAREPRSTVLQREQWRLHYSRAEQWRHGAEEEEGGGGEGGEGEGEGAAARELRSTVLQREQ